MPDIQFESFRDFLDMGGNGFYVWTSYAFAFIVLGLNLLAPLLQRKRLMKVLQARMQRDATQSGQSEVEE